MMMRTKHYAGTAMDVTRGLPRLIEIFDARRTPKTPMMTVHLTKDYNTAEKAEALAHSIKETTIKHITKTIKLDFLKYRIIIELNKEEVKLRGLTSKKIEDILSEKFPKRFAIEKNTLTIKAPKKVASAIQKLRGEVLSTHISGVKGVSYVVIQKEDRNYVIYTQGTNLPDILKVKGIETKKTKTNDIMETERVFGIEATRNLLVEETRETLKEAGLVVDSRHASLVADTMCADGKIKAIGRHGISGGKASVLARASFEETVKHLLKAGAFGEEDKLKGVVENIIVGQVIALGTGIPELIMKTTEPAKKKK
jgi:DNA-directed RNA polymerase subunit A"